MNMNLMNLLAEAASTGAAEEMSTGAMIIYTLVQMVPLILVFVFFYFVAIRPQRKKDKEAREMLNNLKVGDRICTIGGIYGTISKIKDDVLTIEVGEEKTVMVFARWAVRNVEAVAAVNEGDVLV